MAFVLKNAALQRLKKFAINLYYLKLLPITMCLAILKFYMLKIVWFMYEIFCLAILKFKGEGSAIFMSEADILLKPIDKLLKGRVAQRQYLTRRILSKIMWFRIKFDKPIAMGTRNRL